MKRLINKNIMICEFDVFYARNKGKLFMLLASRSSIIRCISNVTLQIRPLAVYLDLADKKNDI